MRTAVVIQARMGSTRFPGKVMAMLDGKAMLRFMLDRLRPLEDDGIDLWVATTLEPEDDVISDALCHNEVIRCFRGSKDNVLSRYQEIAKDYDVIVRLTGDCPLVWAGHVRRVLSFHKQGYTACLDVDGLEVQVYDRAVLEQMGSTRAEREHLIPDSTRWKTNIVHLASLSVDTPEDLERVREFVR